MHRCHFRPLAVLAITLIVVACAPSPVPSPVMLASPSVATRSPTQNPSAAPSSTDPPQPQATATPSPSPAPLTFVWHRATAPFVDTYKVLGGSAPGGFAVIQLRQSGPGSVVWLSRDGSTWRRLRGAPNAIDAVSGDGSRRGLVVVGCAQIYVDSCLAGGVWHSTDRVHWRSARIVGLSKANAPRTELGNVAANGGRVIALSDSILTSTDGSTWRLVRGAPNPRSVGWTSLVPAGSGFIATGQDETKDTGGGGPAVVLTSPDGLTWTRGFEPPGIDEGFPVVAAGGGPGYVVAGNTADGAWAIWTSPDGVQWSKAPSDPSLAGAAIEEMVGTKHGLVAAGTTSQDGVGFALWTSTDGLNWALAPDQPPEWSAARLVGLVTDGQRVLVLANSDKVYSWTSPLPR